MKPEQSERFFVESLVKQSIERGKINDREVREIDKLTGDASTRRYYRVQADKDSYVVCVADPVIEGKDQSPFLQVHRALHENKVRVPHLPDTMLDRGYYLEEDLGDVTLLHRLADIESEKEELELYKKSIDLVLAIHAIDPERYRQEQFTKMAFDEEKLMNEVLFTIKFFIKRFLKCELSLEDESIIVSTFLDICRKIENEHRVLTHRDYHSRNLMVKGDEMIVIDFQDARMGIPQYDLVSLLEDCYYQLSPENVDKLKKYYWESFPAKHAFQNSYHNFCYYYDLMAMQRVFKAIGSFGFIYAGRQDLRYVKYIGYGMEKLRSLLLKYPEYNGLRKALSRVYYGN